MAVSAKALTVSLFFGIILYMNERPPSGESRESARDNFFESLHAYRPRRERHIHDGAEQPALQSPEAIERAKKREAGEKAIQELEDIAKEIGEKYDSPDLGDEKENRTYKNESKIKLKEFKEIIQQYDTFLDKERQSATKHKTTPLVTDREWRGARGTYKTTWQDLQSWAEVRKVWDKTDEKELNQEMRDVRSPENWVKTRGTIYLGLYGGFLLNKALIGGVFKNAKMLGSEFDIYNDYQKSAKMIDAWLYPKPGKGKGKQAKKEEFSDTKQHESNIKIRDLQIKLLQENNEKIKNGMDERGAQFALPPFSELSDTEKEANEEYKAYKDGKEAWQKDYKNTWRRVRMYWIREGAWDEKSEGEFRKAPGTLQQRDLLTDQEHKKLRRLEKEHREKEISESKATEEEKKEKIGEQISEIKAQIEELEAIMEDRKKNNKWPPFGGKGKGKQGQDTIDIGTDETEASGEDDESEPQAA